MKSSASLVLLVTVYSSTWFVAFGETEASATLATTTSTLRSTTNDTSSLGVTVCSTPPTEKETLASLVTLVPALVPRSAACTCMAPARSSTAARARLWVRKFILGPLCVTWCRYCIVEGSGVGRSGLLDAHAVSDRSLRTRREGGDGPAAVEI